MTFRVNETDHDHIPEEITVESLLLGLISCWRCSMTIH